MLLFNASFSQPVAPYDANEKCSKSNISSNVTILLDTNHYNVTDLLGKNGAWVSISESDVSSL